jgi:hypothetical protein
MLSGTLVVVVSFAYLLLLFAIAYYGDRRAEQGRSIIANPWTYALSLAVYCTAWTYFGSVGRAASAASGSCRSTSARRWPWRCAWFLLLKMIRIAKSYRITSIADFIASRYGKSHLLGGLVTVITVVGIIPYIALQLKAVSMGYALLTGEGRQQALQPARGPLVPGQHFLRGHHPRGVHHPVRRAPPRRHRAARGHGGGHRLRVGRQAGRLPGRGAVRHLRHLQRLRRHLSAAPTTTRAGRPADLSQGRHPTTVTGSP